MPTKFPALWGRGVVGFFLREGGRSADSILMGAGIFPISGRLSGPLRLKVQSRSRTRLRIR